MGCCGCDNRNSANTAAIFALVQCVVGLILAVYNLSIFYGSCNYAGLSDKTFLCYYLFDLITLVRVLLIVSAFLYVTWGISSIFLLIGNANNKAGYLQQWVIISSIIIICDFILPAILLVFTYKTSEKNGHDSINETFSNNPSLVRNYLLLLLTFCRGGLVTWISNISLTNYTSRRMAELRSPPGRMVLQQPVQALSPAVVQGSYLQLSAQPLQYLQQGFVSQQHVWPAAPEPFQGYSERNNPYEQPPNYFNQNSRSSYNDFGQIPRPS